MKKSKSKTGKGITSKQFNFVGILNKQVKKKLLSKAKFTEDGRLKHTNLINVNEGGYYKIRGTNLGVKLYNNSGDIFDEYFKHKKVSKRISFCPKVYGLIQLDDNNFGILMDHIVGKPLGDTFDYDETYDILDRIDNKLFKRGIIHDDLHSNNVIKNKNKLYVIDFEYVTLK